MKSLHYSDLLMNKLSIIVLSASVFWSQPVRANLNSKLLNRQNQESLNQKSHLVQNFRQNRQEVDQEQNIPQTISDIEVSFVDSEDRVVNSKTNPNLITREFELKPGDTYDGKLAQKGLTGVNDLIFVERASLEFEPARTGNIKVVVKVIESNPLFFSLGGISPPSALQGPIHPQTVSPSDNEGNGIGNSFRVGVNNLGGSNQSLSLGVSGGEQNFGLDLDYRKFIKHDTGFAANIFTDRNVEPEFDEGEIEINLPDGDDPWVNRNGGGVEYFQPISGDWLGALGVNYQLVSLRDGAFTGQLEPLDELGNSLTVSDDGQDPLLTVNFVTSLDRRNNPSNATTGYRLAFETAQSIPIGDANILSNRLAANYTHYIPTPLFGFTKGDRTLVLNLQAGTILGDVPPFEAFNLGGSSSIRGFSGGEVGTGRSFVQATAEYRFPIFGFTAFEEKFDIDGNLFVDYGSLFSTQDNVIGQPGIVRDKPGDGLGYGLGLRTLTSVGIVKLEFALNNEGGSEVIFQLGDRF